MSCDCDCDDLSLMLFQRILILIVTSGVILASNEHAQTRVVAMLKRAPNSLGVPPHDLHEVKI